MADYRRFFAEPSCKDGNQITITGEEYKHLANVLRMRVGDNCFVCFNDGIDHFCQIESIDKSCAHMCILNSWQTECENAFTTTLYMAVTKGDKNDTIVQKAVELGVSEIVPVEMARSIVKLDEKKNMQKTARPRSFSRRRRTISLQRKTRSEVRLVLQSVTHPNHNHQRAPRPPSIQILQNLFA